MERDLHLAAVANMKGKRCKLTDNLVLKNAEFTDLCIALWQELPYMNINI